MTDKPSSYWGTPMTMETSIWFKQPILVGEIPTLCHFVGCIHYILGWEQAFCGLKTQQMIVNYLIADKIIAVSFKSIKSF